jgi:hypothetical protein
MQDYFDNTYGLCSLNDENKECSCLKRGGLGVLCPNWTPISIIAGKPITSYNMLIENMQLIRDQNEHR